MLAVRKDNIWQIEHDAKHEGRRKPGPARYWAKTKIEEKADI